MSRFPIAHILSSFGVGGQERVALELAAAHVRQGHSVLAVSLAPERERSMAPRFREAGVDTAWVAHREGFSPAAIARLAVLLRHHRAAVVHTHNPKPLIYGAPASRIAGAVLIHTKHGRNPSTRASRAMRFAAGRLADAFVAVSNVTAAQALRQRDCSPSRLHVIPNGIDTELYRPDPGDRAELRAELGIPDRAWVIGTVGRIDDNKNQVLLVDAAAPLLGGNVRLVIVGDGPARGAVEARARRRGVADRVHLTGLRSDVPRLLTVFDVFALSSDSEGLPLVLPEAMAAGLPVASTSVGGIPEVIDDRVGRLVPPGDASALRAALAELEHDRSGAMELGRRARARARRDFSVEAMARAYRHLYRQAIAGRGGARGAAAECA